MSVGLLALLDDISMLAAFAPSWLISSILVLGGCYLAFEGTEKIHEFLEEKFYHPQPLLCKEGSKNKIELSEEKKIKSAIFTDFILSIEIVLVALSTVLNKSLTMQILIVSLVAIAATFFVYGIVALIVRLDDFGEIKKIEFQYEILFFVIYFFTHKNLKILNYLYHKIVKYHLVYLQSLFFLKFANLN